MTKLKNLLLVGVAIIFLLSCAHKVFSLNVEEKERVQIDSALHKVCDSATCQLKECWREKADVIFCEIEFSLQSDSSQEETMKKIAMELSQSGLKYGFCGRDSIGTKLTSAFFEGIGSGIASAAIGGSSGLSGDIVTVSTHDSLAAVGDGEQIDLSDACNQYRNRVVEVKRN